MSDSSPLKAGVLSRIMTALVIAFLIAPLLAVIPISFGQSSLMQFPPREFSLRWYQQLASDPRWLTAAVTSIQIGLIVSLISTFLATITAIGLARFDGRAKPAIQALVLSPLLVPVIVSGVALYYLFSVLRLTGTVTALVTAHVLLTFPYGVVVVTAALERFDIRLEHAAASLGANGLQVFWRVTLPVIRPAVIVAALFGFLVSFDEVVMALLLSGPETVTLPKQMWDGIRFDLTPVIAAVSTVLLVLSGFLVGVAEIFRRRSTRNIHADL